MIKFDKIQQLLERERLDALLVMSAENRRYLSEFTGSSGALIITKESRFLMSDFRYKAQGAEQAEEFEFILQEKGLLESIVSFMNSKGLKRIGFEGEHVNYNTYSQLRKSFDVVPLTGEVEKIRLIKTDEELDLIIKACEIADQSYEYILTYVKAGMTELEVKNELEAHMTSLGASGPSFDTIVASGHRGALPHGVASDKVIEDGDMDTLDFGAWYKSYASDITRTFAVGSVSQEMEEIYNIVLESQLKSLDEIKAGMTGKEADSIARDVISAKGHGE